MKSYSIITLFVLFILFHFIDVHVLISQSTNYTPTIVVKASKHDTSPTLSIMNSSAAPIGTPSGEPRVMRNPEIPENRSIFKYSTQGDAVVQSLSGTSMLQNTILNFDGIENLCNCLHQIQTVI